MTRPVDPDRVAPSVTVSANRVVLPLYSEVGPVSSVMPLCVPPVTCPDMRMVSVIVGTVLGTSIVIADPPALVTVAPLATVRGVPGVVTRMPATSVPVQVVMPFASVGSGAHCAKAGAASASVMTRALVCNARARTRRADDILPTM